MLQTPCKMEGRNCTMSMPQKSCKIEGWNSTMMHLRRMEGWSSKMLRAPCNKESWSFKMLPISYQYPTSSSSKQFANTIRYDKFYVPKCLKYCATWKVLAPNMLQMRCKWMKGSGSKVLQVPHKQYEERSGLCDYFPKHCVHTWGSCSKILQILLRSWWKPLRGPCLKSLKIWWCRCLYESSCGNPRKFLSKDLERSSAGSFYDDLVILSWRFLAWRPCSGFISRCSPQCLGFLAWMISW